MTTRERHDSVAISSIQDDWIRQFIKIFEWKVIEASRSLPPNPSLHESHAVTARAIVETYFDSGMKLDAAVALLGKAAVKWRAGEDAWNDELHQRLLMLIGKDVGEVPVEPWKHLVRRPHPWRQQLHLKGRNMTARQLAGGIRANQLDEEKASANYRLPVEAIQEALAYVEKNKGLLEAEAEIERLMLKREGIAHGPRPVP